MQTMNERLDKLLSISDNNTDNPDQIYRKILLKEHLTVATLKIING